MTALFLHFAYFVKLSVLINPFKLQHAPGAARPLSRVQYSEVYVTPQTF